MNRQIPLPPDIGERIKDTLLDYIRVESYSFSAGEKEAERFFCGYFAVLPYFQRNPELTGAFPIPGDAHNRAVCYAMVRGNGADTVVLLHHYDIAGIEDFKTLRHLAFSPDELAEELRKISHTLAPEVQADLADDAYLFGRGVCDMKGGGAIQMELLRHYSSLADFPGTVIVLGLPDEENLSAGMRAAVRLLERLRERYGLRFMLAVNSEPHQRKDPRRGMLSLGSVGKLMPFVYVRGSLAHAGQIFEGLNPMLLLCEIARRTEAAIELSDFVEGEAAPPPTWLYLRDNKAQYDVSMPLSAFGCLSILTLTQTPGTVMDKIRKICEEAFAHALRGLNQNYVCYLQARNQPSAALPWQVRVTDFAALVAEAEAGHGGAFSRACDAFMRELAAQISQEGPQRLIQSYIRLIDFIYDYIDDLSPRVVYGLLPPYYPHAGNHLLKRLEPRITELPQALCTYAEAHFALPCEVEKYYTGISDLSYTSLSGSAEIDSALYRLMPGFQFWYGLPLQLIEQNSMPCINIGPWGKDFHKLTERVNCRDLYERTPALINQAVQIALGLL